MQFEWDAGKAAANLKKHRVSFDEATTVFRDPLAVIFDDEDHSAVERREIMVGHSPYFQCAVADQEGAQRL